MSAEGANLPLQSCPRTAEAATPLSSSWSAADESPPPLSRSFPEAGGFMYSPPAANEAHHEYRAQHVNRPFQP